MESDTHQAAVRLTWDNESKNWLLTAFEKKNSAFDNTTDTGETLKEGKQNDTATLQNTVSESKDTTTEPITQDIEQENLQQLYITHTLRLGGACDKSRTSRSVCVKIRDFAK
ncbi:MAG: hypothetical protein IKK35_08230 [Rikenellaceae bacterium]|nr:hypothetical protein [Rikenellaceae bacterium]